MQGTMPCIYRQAVKNGVAVKAAFDIARDREYAYKYIFDKYIRDLMDVDMEFV